MGGVLSEEHIPELPDAYDSRPGTNKILIITTEKT